LFGSAVLFVDRWHFMVDQPPIDFQLNWVAAHRLLDREPLYDRAASRTEGMHLIGPSILPEFSAGAAYPGLHRPPATPPLYTPFTRFGAGRAATVYRIVQGTLMLIAVVVTGFAVPRRSRWAAWTVGILALLLFWPVQESIGLDQVDGFIMCSLAIGFWGIA